MATKDKMRIGEFAEAGQGVGVVRPQIPRAGVDLGTPLVLIVHVGSSGLAGKREGIRSPGAGRFR